MIDYIYCSARHEVESETSKRKCGRPSKNTEKEKE